MPFTRSIKYKIRFVKHFFRFLLLTIFNILINPENADLRVFEIIGLAIFCLFMVSTTRSHYIFVLLTLHIISCIYS
jgi:hypothetical protein